MRECVRGGRLLHHKSTAAMIRALPPLPARFRSGARRWAAGGAPRAQRARPVGRSADKSRAHRRKWATRSPPSLTATPSPPCAHWRGHGEGTGDFSFARVERGFRANAGVRVKSEVVMSARQPPSSTGCRSSDTQQRWFAAALLSLVATCSAACTCRSQRGIQTCLTRLAFLKNANALETARHQTKAIT